MPRPIDLADLRLAERILSKPGDVIPEHLPLMQDLRNRGLVRPLDRVHPANCPWVLTPLGRRKLADAQPKVICHRRKETTMPTKQQSGSQGDGQRGPQTKSASGKAGAGKVKGGARKMDGGPRGPRKQQSGSRGG